MLNEPEMRARRLRARHRPRLLPPALAWAAVLAALGVVGLLGGAVTVRPTPVAAATTVLAPTKDNTLYQDPTGAVSNGAGTYLFAGRTNGGSIRRGLLTFDIAATVPANATITSATLRLTLSRTIGQAETIELHRALADWGEGASNAGTNEGQGGPVAAGDATWLHRFYDTAPWATLGGDFSPTVSAAASVGTAGSYAWSGPAVVADVQAWLDDPLANAGWVITGNETATTTTKRFNTKEHPTIETRPVLEIEFTTPDETPSPTPTITATPTPDGPQRPTSTPEPFGEVLFIPPVLTGADISISIDEACVPVLRGPCTEMWTYGGTYPGPTIRRPTGETTNITFTNNLSVAAGEMTVHNHGNHSSPESDGAPAHDLIATGDSRTYTYEGTEAGGNERATTQFYHDHRMDLTGRNVWNGLMGFYIIEDPSEPATLPSGDFDIPLMVADRRFDAANQIPYTFNADGVSGDTILVNGVNEPHLDVTDRKYRFRILNGSNARVYDFALSTGQPFTQIGTESGLLPAPIDRTDMRAGPAERLDVVVDFAGPRRRAPVPARQPNGSRHHGVPRHGWRGRCERRPRHAPAVAGTWRIDGDAHVRLRPDRRELDDQRPGLRPRALRRAARAGLDGDVGPPQHQHGRAHHPSARRRSAMREPRRRALPAIRADEGDMVPRCERDRRDQGEVQRPHGPVRLPLPHPRARGQRHDVPVRGCDAVAHGDANGNGDRVANRNAVSNRYSDGVADRIRRRPRTPPCRQRQRPRRRGAAPTSIAAGA